MTPILHLTARSIGNRGVSVTLTVLSIALSVCMLLGVERVRDDARESFANTLSGTDLIVGPRTGSVPLLLYSVFHIGNATNNIRWKSVEAIKAHPMVDWVVPLSLGDSHRGFRVVGTDAGYFRHYRYGHERPLTFSAGRSFSEEANGLFEAVIGAEVATQLGYVIGSPIVVAHGTGEVSVALHDDKPFTVVGILQRTGTPVDRSVHVSLRAIEAIHVDWQGGMPVPGLATGPDDLHKADLTPKAVTAALVGLKSRVAVFQVQRFIDEYPGEPLLAILPAGTLQELWGVVGFAEQALLAVSALVVVVGLAGLVAVMAGSLGERRRELAILRALGASPAQLFMLLATESVLLTLSGCALGLVFLYGATAFLAPWAEARWGLALNLALPTAREALLLAAVMGAGLVASVFPAWRAYRMSVADGMTVRI